MYNIKIALVIQQKKLRSNNNHYYSIVYHFYYPQTHTGLHSTIIYVNFVSSIRGTYGGDGLNMRYQFDFSVHCQTR